jgi:hypothetical protein
MSFLFSVGSPILAGIAVVVAMWHIRASTGAPARSHSTQSRRHLPAARNEPPTETPKGESESFTEDWPNNTYQLVHFFEYLGHLLR